MDNETATVVLREYLNSRQHPEIMSVIEDDHYFYFDTQFITPMFWLKAMGYDTTYQETKTGYHVRVLKPNWFSHGLELQQTN